MNRKHLCAAAIGLLSTLASPLVAQEAAEETAPAPPPISIEPPPEGIEKDEGSLPPRPVSYDLLGAKPADYPPEAWVAGDEGSVRFELSVSKEGKPEKCTILASSGSALLDQKTCSIAMERGVFEPALNAEGEPVPGKYVDYIDWRKQQPEFGTNTIIDVTFTVTAEGKVDNCNVNEMSGDPSDTMRKSFEREPCPGMDRPPRAVYRDENGYPVAKRVNLKVLVEANDILE